MRILSWLDEKARIGTVILFSIIGGTIALAGLVTIWLIWIVRGIVDALFKFTAAAIMGEENYKTFRFFFTEFIPGAIDEEHGKVVDG